MMRNRPASLPLWAGIFAVFCARPAPAEAAACSPVEVQVDPHLTSRWPGLVSQVREALDMRDDIDRCARVLLSWHDTAVTVDVSLPDGRAAARSVSRREDVVPTLESLLLVPQRDPQAQSSTPEPSAPGPTPALPGPPPASTPRSSTPPVVLGRSVGVPERDVLSQASGRNPSHLRVELSVVTGARIGDGQTGLGLGAISFLDLSGWLVGFEGRADRYRALASPEPGPPSPERPSDGGALELAGLVGRRFRFESVALDLTAGLAAAMQGTTTFVARPSSSGGTIQESSSSTVPRLLLGTRVSFNALSTVHTFVGIDGELGPSRAGDTIPGAPRLPLWTLGLALGATVGTK